MRKSIIGNKKNEIIYTFYNIVDENEVSHMRPKVYVYKEGNMSPAIHYHDIAIAHVKNNDSFNLDNIENGKYDLVIIHEGHLYSSDMGKKLNEYFQESKRVFLTTRRKL